MAKNLELTIYFRGKDISLSKARKYISDLASGEIEPELNEEEKRDYNSFKKYMGEEETEKEYLIGHLEAAISIAGHSNDVKRWKKEN